MKELWPLGIKWIIIALLIIIITSVLDTLSKFHRGNLSRG